MVKDDIYYLFVKDDINYLFVKADIYYLFVKDDIYYLFVKDDIYCLFVKAYIYYLFVKDDSVEDDVNLARSAFIFAVSRRFVSENWVAITTRHRFIMKKDPI